MTQMQLTLEVPAYQPTLTPEPRTLARTDNPVTSKQAAERVKEFARGHHEMILSVLRTRGDLTVHEIAAYCRLDAHAVGKRMQELEKDGRVQVEADANGQDLLRKTPSGRSARVWGVV